MIDATQFQALLERVRPTSEFRAVRSPLIVEPLRRIGEIFEANPNPFERHRAICAQIGAVDDADLRRALGRMREEFEATMLSAAMGDVRAAFAQSAADGWMTWRSRVADALSLGHFRHSMQLCEGPFPFEPSQSREVEEVKRTVSCMQQGRWEEAFDGIEFISRFEISSVARGRLISLAAQIELWRFEKSEPARQRFEEATRIAPKDGSILAAFGDYWLEQKYVAKAVECYTQAISLAPNEADGYAGMGDLAWTEEKFDEAEPWYRKAVSLAAGDSRGYSRLQRALARREIFKQREKEFFDLLDARLAVDPEGAYNAYLDVAQYCRNRDDLPGARQWYEKAIALEEGWPRAYCALADLCRAQNDEDRAEALCKKSMELAPEYPDAYFTLAKLHEDRGQLTRAMEIYSKSPLRPAQWKSFAIGNVGRLRAKLGAYDEAESMLLNEMQRRPEESYAQVYLENIAIDLYKSRGDKGAAERIFAEILRVVGARYTSNYHNLLGNMHYHFAEYRAAIDEYKIACTLRPDDAIFHRNLGGAYQLAGDYDDAEKEFEAAYDIDKNEPALKEKRASVANLEGNRAFANGRYDQAVPFYQLATELNPSEPVYFDNLGGAWERLKDAANWEAPLDRAIEAFLRAQKIHDEQHRAERIRGLQRRKTAGHTFGKKALELLNVVTPIAVEVAGDLIPYIEGSSEDALSKELSADVETMRESILTQLGVKVPGLRFRGNKTDLPDGTYIIMINEIPLVSGSMSLARRFVVATPEALSALGIHGELATDPLTGQPSAWIDKNDSAKAESSNLQPWNTTKYLMRHVEAVVRKNLTEFLGHQKIVNLLESDASATAAELLQSPPAITALTTVCSALVAEEVPIQPFEDLCKLFAELRAKEVSLREIVERVRLLPLFRERLRGNDGRRAFVGLSAAFEDSLRRSIYEREGRLLLAMEPEHCQEALAAVRNRVSDGSYALVVKDGVLRPFVRRLVELEFPDLPVLAQAELRSDPRLPLDAAIDLDEPRAVGRRADFAVPVRSVGSQPDTERDVDASRVLTELRIEVRVAQDFDWRASTFEAMPAEEMFSKMRDGLFYELGILLPEVQAAIDSALKSAEFRVLLNGVEYQTLNGLERDEFLVNETVDRLTLLRIEGREAVNPANGSECAIVRNTQGQAETCKQAGLTLWDSRGFLILHLSSLIRAAAARFQPDDLTEYTLESLAAAFPDLVRIVLQRYPLPELSRVLRALLEEEISIRDLRSILESLLSIDGTTDIDLNRFIVFLAYTDGLCPAPASRHVSDLTTTQRADFVRASLKRYISHKYTRGSNTLVVYLLAPAIERRLIDAGTRPLADSEREELLKAVDAEVGTLPPTAQSPVLLTTFEVRHSLRKVVEKKYPRLAVVSYQELSPDMNIQPIARISVDSW